MRARVHAIVQRIFVARLIGSDLSCDVTFNINEFNSRRNDRRRFCVPDGNGRRRRNAPTNISSDILP